MGYIHPGVCSDVIVQLAYPTKKRKATVKSGVIDQKGEIDHRITQIYLFVMENKYQFKLQ